MAILYALILGIVQGLTEFLPVSSSGHLLLLEHIFGVGQGGLFFNVLLHFATLIAVIVVLRKEVVDLVKHPLSRPALTVIVASIPTAILALLLEKTVSSYAMVEFLGYGFLITALLITTVCLLQKRRKGLMRDIGYREGLIIGTAQGLAVFPGISRSGSTIAAALLMGVEREQAAKFSFLISIPVILGGMVFETADGIKNGFGNINVLACIVGFVAAFLTAIFTIKLMMKVVKSGKWWPFAIYLILLGILVILNQYWLCWF